MDYWFRLVGPNQTIEIMGVKPVGKNAENGMKLLITLGLIIFVLLFGRLLRAAIRWLPLGRRDGTVAFWVRQGIRLFTAALLLVGLLSIWFNDPTRLATGLGLVTAGLAFALQKVITAVAGYFVILRGNTFNVGDRIRMGGVRGDVIALGFIKTTIMEMGQPPPVQADEPAMGVESRQYTGRMVSVSNSAISMNRSTTTAGSSRTSGNRGLRLRLRPLPGFGAVFGLGYGKLLNRVKGGEMMIATYVGFSSVMIMSIAWLILPYKSPTMIWGFGGEGLRTTISVEGFWRHILDDFLVIRIGENFKFPTGAILVFILVAVPGLGLLPPEAGYGRHGGGLQPDLCPGLRHQRQQDAHRQRDDVHHAGRLRDRRLPAELRLHPALRRPALHGLPGGGGHPDRRRLGQQGDPGERLHRHPALPGHPHHDARDLQRGAQGRHVRRHPDHRLQRHDPLRPDPQDEGGEMKSKIRLFLIENAVVILFIVLIAVAIPVSRLPGRLPAPGDPDDGWAPTPSW